jgi:hypothetical protein
LAVPGFYHIRTPLCDHSFGAAWWPPGGLSATIGRGLCALARLAAILLVAARPVRRLQADKIQGECGEADSDSLELLEDGTLLYVSKGEGWETKGVLNRAIDEYVFPSNNDNG